MYWSGVSVRAETALIAQSIAKQNRCACRYFVRTSASVTCVGIKDQRNVQVIALNQRSPTDWLMDFDLDCATFAYDGQMVWTLPRGRRALNTRVNFVDPFVIRHLRNR